MVSFKPTKMKIILSLVGAVVWYAIFFLLSTDIGCIAVVAPCKENFPSLITTCGCTTPLDLVGQILFFWVLPFAVVYVILSLKPIGSKTASETKKGVSP